MDHSVIFNPGLTRDDRLVLERLVDSLEKEAATSEKRMVGLAETDEADPKSAADSEGDDKIIGLMQDSNNPASATFEPTVFTSWDLAGMDKKSPFYTLMLGPYIQLARTVVRKEADVVMLTHLLLYFGTSVPSAITLYARDFSWTHAIAHLLMQALYVGTYTLMMHQHIHARGILAKRWTIVDTIFPYITDPLMGHTWNTYFYHHTKHHHVEGNGPDDLSSTLRFQRDSLAHFLIYVGRFFFFIWMDLPLYFVRKRKYEMAAKVAFWEWANYALYVTLFRISPRATIFVFLVPLFFMRLGLMAGNWGQHAFVDHEEPDSDYRSSITLVDVQSNRHCFNDGYHTSHHLNPLRHWRDHPQAFLKGREQYAAQGALVLHNIDYLMITVRLLMKDYATLAKCMVPINGEQMAMTMADREAFLREHTRPFTEKEIAEKFRPAITALSTSVDATPPVQQNEVQQ